MKFYADHDGERRLVGRADVAPDAAPLVVVRLFGAPSMIEEHYVIGTVTHLSADGGPVVERAVLLGHEQAPDFLPGWQPLAS